MGQGDLFGNRSTATSKTTGYKSAEDRRDRGAKGNRVNSSETNTPLTQVIDLSHGAFLDYTPAWLPDELAQRYMDALLAEISWQQPNISIAGQSRPIPRLQAWYGEQGTTMAYSGRSFRAQGWHPVLIQIKDAIEACCDATFNSVLVNLYRNGQDSVSWHADDEPEFGPNPTIASVSLGQSRKFSLKPKTVQISQTSKEGEGGALIPAAKRSARHLELNSGDLLIMRGTTQANWVHAIPKQSRVSSARINLTFRRVIP